MYKLIKRLFDFFGALIALILLLPLFIVVALSIKLTSRGPVFFRQVRLGKNLKPFKIYKFRTMKINTPEASTGELDASKYITKVGGILRKTSIDELPQFINVLFGQMSWIGPRPHIPKETQVFEEREKFGANKVKPGLTGLAQINGRDNVSIKKKTKLDAIYVMHFGFWMDFKIFFKTIAYVLKGHGHAEGEKIEKSKKM